jgi:hypothetical protein
MIVGGKECKIIHYGKLYAPSISVLGIFPKERK